MFSRLDLIVPLAEKLMLVELRAPLLLFVFIESSMYILQLALAAALTYFEKSLISSSLQSLTFAD